jgi:methylenetetrahydrofolate reductase (NADPH)
MKISALLSDPGRKIFSFELFPPKTDAGRLALERTIRDLADLSPAFVSVTYGAGGSTRAKTLDLVQWIEREARLCAMAHLTCVGATESEIAGVLDKLVEAGIENVMADRRRLRLCRRSGRLHP